MVAGGEETVFQTLGDALQKANDGDTVILEPGLHLQPNSLIFSRQTTTLMSRALYAARTSPQPPEVKPSETLIVGRERGFPVIMLKQGAKVTIEGLGVVFFPESSILIQEDEEDEAEEDPFDRHDAVIDVRGGTLVLRSALLAGKICHGLVVRSGSCDLQDVTVDGMPPTLFPAGVDARDFDAGDLTLLHGVMLAGKAVGRLENCVIRSNLW